MVEDFLAKDVNDTGDCIVLHLNVFKMLLNEESPDAQVLRQILSSRKICFEKTLHVLREQKSMRLKKTFSYKYKRSFTVIILCYFDPTRWEQLSCLQD